ncbi:hypothetical protein Nepgr_029618 [Nepenthes gracilis]|uniref:C2H2-type domain-containing protein n=1 Tax=Nepenthes gracilis TaxID=150966 RepID=A0AAD3TDX3_NEPGR|nr:hypothetical protein Nepgr_029618 [Nepenthes gracilis]
MTMKRFRNKTAYPDAVAAATRRSNHSCCVCGKSFSSIKAVHGHMKWHPEREWRGMLPPMSNPKRASPPSISTLSVSEIAADADGGGEKTNSINGVCQFLSEPDSHSAVKAWRGRKRLQGYLPSDPSKGGYSSPDSSTVSTTTTAAAKQLAEGSNPLQPEDDGNGILACKKPRIVDHSSTESRSTADFGTLCRAGSYSNTRSRELLYQKSELNLSQEKSKDNRLLNKFECSICGKSFNSCKALGGHRSSHTKVKSMEVSGSRAANLLPCKVNGRVFESLRSLGGHKTCHWTPPTTTIAKAPPLVMAAAAAHPEKKMLNFDLNELPYLEVEEQLPEQFAFL